MYTWYTEHRHTAEIKSLSIAGSNANFVADLRTFGSIKNSAMIDSIPHGIYFYAKAEIIEVRKDNAYYPACDKCNKKITNDDQGLRCEKCPSNNPTVKMRYMLNLNLSDGTDTVYVTLFDEQATSLLGISAEVLDNHRRDDERKFNSYFEPLLFQSVIARMRAQYDYYNDQKRMKFTVYNIKPVPFPQYQIALDAALATLENL